MAVQFPIHLGQGFGPFAAPRIQFISRSVNVKIDHRAGANTGHGNVLTGDQTNFTRSQSEISEDRSEIRSLRSDVDAIDPRFLEDRHTERSEQLNTEGLIGTGSTFDHGAAAA